MEMESTNNRARYSPSTKPYQVKRPLMYQTETEERGVQQLREELDYIPPGHRRENGIIQRGDPIPPARPDPPIRILFRTKSTEMDPDNVLVIYIDAI